MAPELAKGSRITGTQRAALAAQYAKRYAAGESIRKIAEDEGRSVGFVHRVLKESDVDLRGRGGATRGASAESDGRSTEAAPATSKRAAKTAKAPAAKAPATKTAKAPATKTAKAPATKTAKAPATKTAKAAKG